MPTAVENMRGMSTNPARVGVTPRTSCTKSGTKKMPHQSSIPLVKFTPTHIRMTGSRMIRSGSTGSAARCSCHRKTANRVKAAATRAMSCADRHGSSRPPRVATSTRQASPLVSVAEPTQSRAWGMRRYGQPQLGGDDRDGDGADGQVDVERPAPAQVVDEEAAEHRPGDAGDREDHALVARASGRAGGPARCRRSRPWPAWRGRRRRGPARTGPRAAGSSSAPRRTPRTRRGRCEMATIRMRLRP